MKRIVLLFTCLIFSTLKAEPWIDTRDAWLRADIEYLSGIGVIKVPVTTWPLMWAPILSDLNNADTDKLSSNELSIYRRVKRKGKFETKLDNHSFLSIKAANQGKILRHFGDEQREKAEINSRTSGMSKNFAWSIEATKVLDPIDGDESRLDNSYLAGIWGNWTVSLGAQERWWGPGWDTSLILSNNARPVPSVSVQRNFSQPFESKWLSWIGPWTFNAFAGQMESDRFIPHAKLLGMSINFKPFNSLELGLRRTAQWGGEGRPETLSSFVNLLAGRDNCDEAGLSCDDQSNEPGNQLAGIDFKWHLPVDTYQSSIYGQIIGEDEAGYAPSRKIKQVGFESTLFLANSFTKIFVEYADTTNEIGSGVTYNHGIYRDGYRYQGRSIGSTFDNDTESVSVGAFTTLANMDDRLKFKLSAVKINKDGTSSNNSVSEKRAKLTRLSVSYQKIIKENLFDLGVSLSSKSLERDNSNSNYGKYSIFLSWTTKI